LGDRDVELVDEIASEDDEAGRLPRHLRQPDGAAE
jgi:hypothetical protein